MDDRTRPVTLRLSQAAEVRLGRQRAPQYEQGDHLTPYLRSANVLDGSLDLADVKSMNFDPVEQSIFGLVPGDVLMTEGSGSAETVGTSAVWGAEIPGTVCFQNTLLRLRPRTGVTDGRFLAWWARHAHSSGQIAAVTTGANIQHIGSDGLKDLRIHVPAVDEQRRIADFLDDRVARIDQIITARRAQMVALSELNQRQLVDELLGAGESPLGKAPWFREGIATVRLSTVWTVIDCKHRTPTYQGSGFPVISPGDVAPDRLDLSRATRFVNQEDFDDLADDLRRCRRGDLVYSRNASAGTAAYVDTDQPFSMGQDVCRITSREANQLYLAYCLNFLTEPQLDSVRVGSTFTRINVDQIKALTIPMRHLKDQIAVASTCDRIVDECRAQEVVLDRVSQLLTAYKQSLITAAVTGELDVTTAGSGIPS